MSKGDATRERILDRAFRVATRAGLDGLSIGMLATELGMSKSGLFAHFGSKEDLQIEVLRAASLRFVEFVWRPALKAAAGEPRLRKLLERWILWVNEPSMPGGCVFFAAAVELDDKDGRPRDFLVSEQKKLCVSLGKGAPGRRRRPFSFGSRLRSVCVRRLLGRAWVQLPAPPDARSEGGDARAPRDRSVAGAGANRQLKHPSPTREEEHGKHGKSPGK